MRCGQSIELWAFTKKTKKISDSQQQGSPRRNLIALFSKPDFDYDDKQALLK